MNRQFNFTFTNGLSVEQQNSFFQNMAAQGQDLVLNSMALEGHDPCLGYMTSMGQDPFLNDVAAQGQGQDQDQDMGMGMFLNDLDTLDLDPFFEGMTAQGQQGMTAQGQQGMTAQGQDINGNTMAGQGHQNMMVPMGQNMMAPMGQNMGFSPVAQQPQGMIYPGQQMGSPTMPQGMTYTGQYMGNPVMHPSQNMGNNMMYQNPYMGTPMMGQAQNNMSTPMMAQAQSNMGTPMVAQAQSNMGTPMMAQAQSNMASPMTAQAQNNVNTFRAQPTTNARAPLGEIPDGPNRGAAPSGPTKAQKGKEAVNNVNRGVKRQAETHGQGAAPKRRDMGGSSKSTPVNSTGVSSNGPAAIAFGSTSQGSTANAPGANAPVSGLDLNTDSLEDNNSALERYLESALDASFLGTDNPVSGLDLNSNSLEDNTSAPGLDFQTALEANPLGTNSPVSGKGLITNPLETNTWFPGHDFQNVLDDNPLATNNPVSEQDLVTNTHETNTLVPGQGIQSAAALNLAAATQPPVAAVTANGQGTAQPGPGSTLPSPPITPPRDGYSALEKEERKNEIFRIWERFKRENDIVKLCSEMPEVAERAKYQDYLEQHLETEKASVRTAFRQYLAVGLPALVRNQPVIEPLGFDGNVSAAVEAAKGVHQADGALPQAAPQASDEMISAKIDEQMAKLETMLPTGLTYGPVEYAKTRPLKMTLPALADPNMPEGTTGPRKRTCHIIRGEGNRVYGGHRGGDFILKYRGRREYAVNSTARFDYMGQVARTSAMLEHRRDALAQRVWDVMRAILGFDPYTSTELAPEHRPGVVSVKAVLEEGPGSVRQQWNARFGVGGTATEEFRRAMEETIPTIDAMREFGWLGWTLRKERGKTDPRYYELLIDMIEMITTTRDNSLRMSYDQSQEKTAKGLVFYLGEFGDRVVVCLESVYEKLFTAHDNPDDPLLHLREPVNVHELARNALATSAAELYRQHNHGVVAQFTAPVDDAPLPQPAQVDDVVSLGQQQHDEAPDQLPAFEDVLDYFQQIIDTPPGEPDPPFLNPFQNAHISFTEQLNGSGDQFQDPDLALPAQDNWLDTVHQLIEEDIAAQIPEDTVHPAEDEDVEPAAELSDEDWTRVINCDLRDLDTAVVSVSQAAEPAPDNTGNLTDQDDDLNNPAVQRVLESLIPFGLGI